MSKSKSFLIKSLLCASISTVLLYTGVEAEVADEYKNNGLISVTQTLEEYAKKAEFTNRDNMEETIVAEKEAVTGEENVLEKVVVKVDTAKVWSEENNSGNVVVLVSEGEEYEVLEKAQDCFKIILEDKNTEGYISANAVEVKVMSKPVMSVEAEQNQLQLMKAAEAAEASAVSLAKQEERKKVDVLEENVTVADDVNAYTNVMSGSDSVTDDLSEKDKELMQIVEYAKRFLGNPYRYGGSSLTKGTDCSGFTMRIYEHFGVAIPHSSSQQSRIGKAVSLDKLQPGDLLFYGSRRSIGHVAMYIGDGKVIHASTEATGIKISDAFYRKPVRARRIVG